MKLVSFSIISFSIESIYHRCGGYYIISLLRFINTSGHKKGVYEILDFVRSDILGAKGRASLPIQ